MREKYEHELRQIKEIYEEQINQLKSRVQIAENEVKIVRMERDQILSKVLSDNEELNELRQIIKYSQQQQEVNNDY